VPSLVIGAIIASVVIAIAFIGFDSLLNQKELVIEPTPTIQQARPPNITINTFLDNGSPILGNPNAPITLVEFGDYQCHFCNVFFHTTEDNILKNYVETGKVRMIFKDYNIIVLIQLTHHMVVIAQTIKGCFGSIMTFCIQTGRVKIMAGQHLKILRDLLKR